jgi:hypothetical protein
VWTPEHADLTWLLEVPPKERDFIERLGREVELAEVVPAPEEAPDPIVPASALEAVPLPSWLKRRLMGGAAARRPPCRGV